MDRPNLPKRIARSCIRVALGLLIAGGIGFATLAFALRQPTLRELPFTSKVRTDGPTLERHVRFLTTEVRPRSASHPSNLERTVVYIEQELRRSTVRTSRQTFRARGGEYANVIAAFGPDNQEPVTVIGAHYDAFSASEGLPGADDNASGTAGLLELARLLAAADLQRPVLLVAFANEEPPFFGSDQMGSAIHAESLSSDHRQVGAMICLEMIGYYEADQTWPNALFSLIYPGKGDFIGVVGGWSDRHLARTVKQAIDGAGIRVVSFSGPRETSDASDHRNYWRHGWNAVMVTDTAFLRNPHYHTAGDTADTLDYRRMARVVDGVVTAALALSENGR